MLVKGKVEMGDRCFCTRSALYDGQATLVKCRGALCSCVVFMKCKCGEGEWLLCAGGPHSVGFEKNRSELKGPPLWNLREVEGRSKGTTFAIYEMLNRSRE